MKRYCVLVASAALAAQSLLVARPALADDAGEAAARARFSNNFTLAHAETCFRELLAQERAAQKTPAAARKPATRTLPNGLVVTEELKDITSFDDPATGTWCSGGPGSGSFTFGVVSKVEDGPVPPPLFLTSGRTHELEIRHGTSDGPVDFMTQKDRAFVSHGPEMSFEAIPHDLAMTFTPKELAFLTGFRQLGDRLGAIHSLGSAPVKTRLKRAIAANKMAIR